MGDELRKKAAALAKWIAEHLLDGIGPLSSPAQLAKEYEINASYRDTDARVRALIRWETAKNFTAGFLTGLGGLIALPIAVPAALGASWLITARMTAAIAVLYGHDLQKDRVRTLVLLSLAGSSVTEVLRDAGIQVGVKLTKKVIGQISGRFLISINKSVGFRLLTKAGEKGIVNLMRMVPVVGGVIAGAFDAAYARSAGRMAMKLLKPPDMKLVKPPAA